MPTFPGPVPFRRDRPGLLLLGLCVLHLALLAPALVYPDLNLDYPFVDGDSPEWIAAGLRLAGHDVRDPGRSPLLPLVVAFLERCSALPWLPVALQLLFHGTVLAFYRFAARRGPPRAAFVVALALLLNHSLHGMSLQVMADVPASCLLFLAGACFVERRYLASGALGGLAALTQSAGLLAAVPAVLVVLVHRRGDLRNVWLWAGALIFLALQGFWIAVRLAVFGSVGNIAAQQWSLIDPGADSFLFYLYSLVSLLGIPGALFLAAGLVPAVREARRDEDRLFWLALCAVLALFFGVLYDFDAKRFLVYLVWPAGLLLSGIVGRLRRGAFAAGAVLLVGGSAFPLPGTGEDPSWIGLWPLPPVYAHAPLTARPSGSPVLQPSGITVRTFPAADLLHFSNLGRVWNERRARAGAPRPERLDPAGLGADHTALFLYRDPANSGGRHRTLSRASSALRKRVKFVPASWLAPWADFLAVEPVGAIEPDYAVFRVRLPNAPGSWLLVTLAGSPLREEWAERARRKPRPAGPRFRRGLEQAEAVRRGISRDTAIVVLLPGSDPSSFYLPFLLETPDLILIEPKEAEALRARIAGAPLLAEKHVAGAEIREIRILGQRVAVVERPSPPAPGSVRRSETSRKTP